MSDEEIHIRNQRIIDEHWGLRGQALLESGVSREEYQRLATQHLEATQLDITYAPYLASLTEDVLDRLCKIIFYPPTQHYKPSEQGQKKALVKGAIRLCLYRARRTIPLGEQRTVLEKLLGQLAEIADTFASMNITRNKHGLPAANDKAWVPVMARNNLLAAMKQKGDERPDDHLRVLAEDIDWLADRVKHTIESAEPDIKISGKRADIFAESLIIPLANAYYELAEKPPEYGYAGSPNTTKGTVIDFIAHILQVFSCGKSPRWIVEQLTDQEKLARSGTAKYASPKWPAE